MIFTHIVANFIPTQLCEPFPKAKNPVAGHGRFPLTKGLVNLCAYVHIPSKEAENFLLIRRRYMYNSFSPRYCLLMTTISNIVIIRSISGRSISGRINIIDLNNITSTTIS